MLVLILAAVPPGIAHNALTQNADFVTQKIANKNTQRTLVRIATAATESCESIRMLEAILASLQDPGGSSSTR